MQSREKIFEGYTVFFDKEIGSGTYGKVYECKSSHEIDQGIPLCAKMLYTHDPDSIKEDDILKILMVKANLNAYIVGIKKIINLKKEENLIIIIMERCLGNLQQELDRKKQFTNEEVREFVKQILMGYAPLVELNIIHRDIKPANILLSQLQGKVIYKLADFGVGKILKKNDHSMTKTGTPVYSPPEINQLHSDSSLTRDLKSLENGKSQIDMYSIGIILYQLLYGKLPLKANQDGVRTFIQQLQKNEFQIQPYLNCDQQLLSTIDGLLKYYPSQRITYQTLCQQYLSLPIQQSKYIQPNKLQPKSVVFQKQQPEFGAQLQQLQPQKPIIGQGSIQQFIFQKQIPTALKKDQQMNVYQMQPKLSSSLPTDPFLLQFREILLNYVDVYNLMGKQTQENEVVQLMQKAIKFMADKIVFKQVVQSLKQHFILEKNKPYSDIQIRLLFSLRFYTDEYSQPLDPQSLNIIQMKDYLK